MKLIDISGFGHSGKTTVTNLFSEVDATHVHDPNFEFGLLRLPDGLIDLKRNVLDNWTPIKSDIQIKRFLNDPAYPRVCQSINDTHTLSKIESDRDHCGVESEALKKVSRLKFPRLNN